jgi:hypothetical protein
MAHFSAILPILQHDGGKIFQDVAWAKGLLRFETHLPTSSPAGSGGMANGVFVACVTIS